MPLEIQYRPIALPLTQREPRRAAAAPVRVPAQTAAEAEFDRLKAAVLADRADAKANRARPFAWLQALARATSFRQRVAGIAAIGVMGVTLGTIGWGSTGITPARAEVDVAGLEPFERAGQSFPGSAFYYLDSDSGVVAAGKTASARTVDGESPAPLDARLGDAIARPTFLAGTAQDQSRALQCLTTAIYYEAASEPDAGQRAVAQVVLNRVAHPLWPNSVCGVVYQGSERPGCQFSFACDGSMARTPVRMWWDRARSVAERALAGDVYAPVGLATYYHTGAVNPVWAARQTFIGAIGAHLFYRPPGGSGGAAAFTDRYWGGEPAPAPRSRLSPPPLLQADPLAVAQSWAVAQSPAAGSPARPAMPVVDSLPAFTPAPGDALPTSGQIRAEYRDSGRWIAAPKG